MLGEPVETQHGPDHRYTPPGKLKQSIRIDDDRDAGRHLILNETNRQAIVEAAEFAENRRATMTIGIRPNADTGCGYIRSTAPKRTAADLQSQNVYRKLNLRTGENIRGGEFF